MPATVVAAAANSSYSHAIVSRSVQHLLRHLEHPLPSMVKKGDRVFVKVNMGCGGYRNPEDRLTTHPIFVEHIICALIDCGAIVSFGDDVARVGKHVERICQTTGMREVAKRTGARLVDLVSAGAREVRGRLLYPRKYLVTNAFYDADVVINAASCRSHVGIGMSGAIKNMFGCVIGKRKQLIHDLFPSDPRGFGRAIADIYGVVRPHLSFLDLTSAAEAAGITLKVQPVGLMLAGTDAAAIDTIAARAIGYEDIPVWPSYYAAKMNLGCNSIDDICVRGLDWDRFVKQRLLPPSSAQRNPPSAFARMTAVANHTVLRPRPRIHPEACNACGDCADRCPVKCIERVTGNTYRIQIQNCADCGCCSKVCETGAVRLEFVGMARVLRTVMGRPREAPEIGHAAGFDPAPKALPSG